MALIASFKNLACDHLRMRRHLIEGEHGLAAGVQCREVLLPLISRPGGEDLFQRGLIVQVL